MRLEIDVVASVDVPVTARAPVVVLLVVVRLVATALVVVELPTIKSVILARVATRDEMKELVEVLLVVVRLAMVPLVP